MNKKIEKKCRNNFMHKNWFYCHQPRLNLYIKIEDYRMVFSFGEPAGGR
jgi:hypothetical protein